MEAFYFFCHAAGPLKCAFHAETPAAIEKRLEDLLEDIRQYPIIVAASPDGPDMPQLITWSHVKRLISRALYQPIKIFEKFASILKALEERDGTPFYQLMQDENSTPPICSVEAIPPNVPTMEDSTTDAMAPIMCSDHPGLNDTAEQFAQYARYLDEVSTSSGAVNTLFRLACIGRTAKPKWEFDGVYEFRERVE